MKKYMDLIREILLLIESKENINEYFDSNSIEIEGYSQDEITYHIRLLFKENYIKAIDASSFDGESYLINSLTWDGHEFLDKIRNDNTWNKTKDIMKEKGLPFTLGMIKQITNVIVNKVTEETLKGIM